MLRADCNPTSCVLLCPMRPHSSAPLTAGNRGYAFSEELFTSSTCGVHVKMLENYLSAPIQLQRAGIALQGANSFNNIRGAVRRYLGYCTTVRSTEAVAAAGLLNILDGPLIAGFVGWLLQSRETTLSTCVQTFLALEKAAHWAVTELLPEAADGGAAYVGAKPYPILRPCFVGCLLTPSSSFAERVKVLTRQLQTWHTKCPVLRPTFEEMKGAGTFIELPDLLAKTIPFSEDALDAFKASPSPETAVELRQACLLSCTAGDSMGNVRRASLSNT